MYVYVCLLCLVEQNTRSLENIDYFAALVEICNEPVLLHVRECTQSLNRTELVQFSIVRSDWQCCVCAYMYIVRVLPPRECIL